METSTVFPQKHKALFSNLQRICSAFHQCQCWEKPIELILSANSFKALWRINLTGDYVLKGSSRWQRCAKTKCLDSFSDDRSKTNFMQMRSNCCADTVKYHSVEYECLPIVRWLKNYVSIQSCIFDYHLCNFPSFSTIHLMCPRKQMTTV